LQGIIKYPQGYVAVRSRSQRQQQQQVEIAAIVPRHSPNQHALKGPMRAHIQIDLHRLDAGQI